MNWKKLAKQALTFVLGAVSAWLCTKYGICGG